MDINLNIVAVNYWKQFQDFRTVLKEQDKLFLLVHGRAEMDVIAHFLSTLHASSILYISVTKTARVVQESSKKLATKVHVVDCVTGGVFKAVVREDCTYASAPYSLLELETLLTTMIDSVPTEYVVFDSLSQFVEGISVDATDFAAFCERLALIGPNARKIFLCDEASKLLRILPRSRFDSIIGLEVIYG